MDLKRYQFCTYPAKNVPKTKVQLYQLSHLWCSPRNTKWTIREINGNNKRCNKKASLPIHATGELWQRRRWRWRRRQKDEGTVSFSFVEKRYQPKCRTNVSSLKKKQQQQQQCATRVIKERRKQGQSLGRGIRVIVQRETTTIMENKDEKEKQMRIIIINKMHIVLTQQWGNNKTKATTKQKTWVGNCKNIPPPLLFQQGKKCCCCFF